MPKISTEIDIRALFIAGAMLVSVAGSATVTAVMANRTAEKLEKVDQRVTVLEKSEWKRAGYEQALKDIGISNKPQNQDGRFK